MLGNFTVVLCVLWYLYENAINSLEPCYDCPCGKDFQAENRVGTTPKTSRTIHRSCSCVEQGKERGS